MARANKKVEVPTLAEQLRWYELEDGDLITLKSGLVLVVSEVTRRFLGAGQDKDEVEVIETGEPAIVKMLSDFEYQDLNRVLRHSGEETTLIEVEPEAPTGASVEVPAAKPIDFNQALVVAAIDRDEVDACDRLQLAENLTMQINTVLDRHLSHIKKLAEECDISLDDDGVRES